jgi:hypothetical protein
MCSFSAGWWGDLLGFYIGRVSCSPCPGVVVSCAHEYGVLRAVQNYRGLRFQWITLFNSNGTMDIRALLGVGDMTGPWDAPYHISKRDLNHEPDMGHDVPFALGTSFVNELLKKLTAELIAKDPLPDWMPVNWFEHDMPSTVQFDVVEKFQDF